MVDYFPELHEEKLISLIAFLEEAASAMGQLFAWVCFSSACEGLVANF